MKMGKKHDEAMAMVREIRAAIPRAADRLGADAPELVRSKVHVNGLVAAMTVERVCDALSADAAGFDADAAADDIVKSAALADAFGSLLLG